MFVSGPDKGILGKRYKNDNQLPCIYFAILVLIFSAMRIHG